MVEEHLNIKQSSSISICNILVSEDPGLWPENINNDFATILVKRGPVQVHNHNFLVNDDGRKFSDNYYYRRLPNGEKTNREWFLYSISKNAVYCFCCKIFGKTASIFFNIIQEIYVFFSSSIKRWSLINKHVPELKLKPLSDTRWSSRVDAVKPLRYHICKIFDALIEIYENTSEFDVTTTHKAHSLTLNIQNYKFICSTIIWFDILNEINSLSKMMQNPTMNVKLCIGLLKNLIDSFKNDRSNANFNKILEEANKIAMDLNIEFCRFKSDDFNVKNKSWKMQIYKHYWNPAQSTLELVRELNVDRITIIKHLRNMLFK
ncbi:Zinc finger MYM-type protein 5 [Trachymyrmex cornetzi]|uniref:Zinc finger MYM-type protein 5 n=1 Tax=Trachymyrmex cornetzi TaxID=471704 RepID=A0A151JMW5_9HYME|nr:Zinc finger MYM-type protein 5 [Trachymyrmex cornetzi]